MKKIAILLTEVVVCGLLVTGCASVSGLLGSAREARSVSIESRWTRSTLNRDFLGYRRLNRMAPLVLDKLVIQSNAVDGIVAYERTTGRQIWRMNVENGAEGGATVRLSDGRIPR
ncbi:MAG: hypothetical protein V4760_13980, partial [Bdellovibrionota bacterium]